MLEHLDTVINRVEFFYLIDWTEIRTHDQPIANRTQVALSWKQLESVYMFMNDKNSPFYVTCYKLENININLSLFSTIILSRLFILFPEIFKKLK